MNGKSILILLVILILIFILCSNNGEAFSSSLEVYPISGKGFSLISDFVFDRRYSPDIIDTGKIKRNNKVFVNLDNLNEFLNILRANPPKNKFTLITHNSDSPFTENSYKSVEKYVNKVYAQNNTYIHPNVYAIPIGFRDYHWQTGTYETYPIIKNIPLSDDKPILLYMNFVIDNNSAKRKREICFNTFKNYGWVTKEKDIPLEKFYSQLSKSKYILSPEGNGIDCHRIYEALYFNSIPILKTSKMDYFYGDLPVIIVDDWNLITKERLETNYVTDYNRLKKWKNDNPNWLDPRFWIR